MGKWFSNNWWWLLILLILGGIGVYYYIKNKNDKSDKNKPPANATGPGGGPVYKDVDGEANPLLKKGTKGKKVAELQKKLIAKGQKVSDNNQPDDLFWNMTQTALKNVTGKTEIYYNDIKNL